MSGCQREERSDLSSGRRGNRRDIQIVLARGRRVTGESGLPLPRPLQSQRRDLLRSRRRAGASDGGDAEGDEVMCLCVRAIHDETASPKLPIEKA